jgi:phosphohistidine phosphatase
MLDWRILEIDAAVMRLLVLRHAKAEKADPGMPDRERPLNMRGQQDAAAMGVYIDRHGLAPDVALISPARRTRETWERIAAVCPMRVTPRFEERLYNAGSNTVLAVLKQAEGIGRTLLVLGHNPGMHDLARILIASGDGEARERLHEGLPTTGLVVIDFAVDGWSKLHVHGGRLERFVSPRSLAAADRV